MSEEILPKTSEINNRLLLACSGNNQTELIEILKHPDVDPTIHNHISIVIAVSSNHTNIVKILLDDGRVDPSVDKNYCLENNDFYSNPLTKNQKEILDLLFVHPKVIAKSIELNQEWHNHDDIMMMIIKHPELLI